MVFYWKWEENCSLIALFTTISELSELIIPGYKRKRIWNVKEIVGNLALVNSQIWDVEIVENSSNYVFVFNLGVDPSWFFILLYIKNINVK